MLKSSSIVPRHIPPPTGATLQDARPVNQVNLGLLVKVVGYAGKNDETDDGTDNEGQEPSPG
jgi:hypothetical protein